VPPSRGRIIIGVVERQDPDRRFADAFAVIRRHLETIYGVRVAWAPIPA
jgi:hypothetical protein